MRYRFAFANEKQLQDGIERMLAAENVAFEREHRLTAKDRPDFFLPNSGIVIEVKIKGATNDVLRQLYRYAEHEQVKAIILVTSRGRHQLPITMHDKPCRAVVLYNL